MSTPKGVGRRALSGMSWTLAGSVISNLVRIGVIASLGRLLTSADFGIVAATMTVILLATRLKEVGIGLALVQRRDVTREHIESTAGVQVLLGAVATAIIFFGAGPLSHLYRMPAAEGPLRALSLLFLIRGISSTSQFLCQRELKFRAIAIIDVVAYLVGSGVSIVLALTGAGPWALVIGYLVETALDSALTMYIVPPPMPRIRWHALRELLGYGGGQTAAGIANYFATQGDYIVVGRVLGDALLGIYTRAYELMRFPSLVFNTVAGGVLFSAFARLQDDPQRLGELFRRVLWASALILMPMSAGLIVLAPEGVRILLGPNWQSAVLPFQIMALSMVWRTGHKSSSIVARSAGDVWWLAVWQAVYAGLVIGGALISVQWGIIGVAFTTMIAVVLQFLNLTRVALRRVSLTWWDVVKAHYDGAVLSALATLGALPTALALRAADVGVVPIAIAATVAGTLPMLAYVAWTIRKQSPDWVWLIERIKTARGKKRKNRKDNRE